MKNCIILAMMLLGFWGLYVAFHTPPAVADGADLKRSCGRANIWNDLACQSYVRGLAEGMSVAIHPAICFPADFDARQALPIVRRYLRTHPGELDMQSPRVVQGAFRDAYPCHWHMNTVPGHSEPQPERDQSRDT
jgi:hypothetical protein